MAAILGRRANLLMNTGLLGAAGMVVFLALLVWGVPRMNYNTQAGFTPTQPVPCSHQHHVSGLGIHAVHLTVGIALVLIMAWRVRRGAFSGRYHAPLEVVGLYWSFVDIVWVFLFAAIYPLGRAGT